MGCWLMPTLTWAVGARGEMSSQEALLLGTVFFAAAVLYSSVGQAGASGYIAVMAFFGLAAEVMKPTALVLNILVATIATVCYWRAGHFSWVILWPFALGAIPFAALGGAVLLPGHIYRPLVGVILLLAAARLLWASRNKGEAAPRGLPSLPAIGAGAGIGFLSGITGTGGGIFLSPLLLFLNWADARKTAGVSAAFILLNSIAGLAGHLASVRDLPPALPLWMVAAALGAVVGTRLGSRKLAPATLRRLLGVVLLIAAFRLMLL